MDGKSSARQTLVVIGHGMTSHALCRRLAECGATRGALHVVVIGEEPRPAYDRVHLTDLFAGRSEADLSLAPAAWYEENGIELHIADRVSAIDRDDCLVRTEAGVIAYFDRLVFATGSRPHIPAFPGVDLRGVFAVRTVADVQAISAYATNAARAAVIGGGLLGLESAHAVRRLGLDVHVVEASPGLLPRQLDVTGARLVRERMEALGVHVHTGRRIAAIEESSHRGACPHRVLRFQDGSTLSADLVIFAAGIRPRSELAAAAGLTLAANGGIAVDDRLATSDPRIFAVGECAAHRGTTYGLAAPGYRMVDVLVNNLAGKDAVFEGARLSARLKLAGVEVAAIGLHDERATPGVAVHIHQAGEIYRKLLVSDGRLVGALAVGPWEDLGRVEDAIMEPRRFSFWDLRRFRSTGSLFLRSESPPVHLWPADALVCGCLGVRRGSITEAELAGCATVDAISARTGAGSMCGSCRPLIADYLRRDRAESIAPQALSARPPASDDDDDGAAEDPPETLRCHGDEAPPSTKAPGAIRPKVEKPRPRPPLDTLPSTVAYRDAVLPSFDHARAVARSDLAVASQAIEEAAPTARPEAVDSIPVSIAPASSIRASHGAREAPMSSRRESMIPLMPISVPVSMLPAVPETRGSTVPSALQIASDERARRVLLASAAAAIAGAILALALPEVPPARSFDGLSADAIVSSRVTREASGYAIIALAVVGSALSIQKRVKRFARLDLPRVRALHALLGAAAIACAILHTGLHLGVRLDRALVIDFLALSALGAASALATALGGTDPASQSRRSRFSIAHVALLLPFPGLLALHVLRAYWF